MPRADVQCSYRSTCLQLAPFLTRIRSQSPSELVSSYIPGEDITQPRWGRELLQNAVQLGGRKLASQCLNRHYNVSWLALPLRPPPPGPHGT